MSKISTFVALTVALLKGDEAQAVAIKNQSKATSILENQLNSQKFELGELKEELSEIEEKANLSLINNGKVITSADKENYIQGILNAEEAVLEVKARIEANEEITSILEAKLEIVKNSLTEIKETAASKK